jgi:hypothetical protein
MKVILEFNLPEERDEHTLALKGREFWNCLWDLDQKCRNALKHGHSYKTADEVLEMVREFIHGEVDLDCVE